MAGNFDKSSSFRNHAKGMHSNSEFPSPERTQLVRCISLQEGFATVTMNWHHLAGCNKVIFDSIPESRQLSEQKEPIDPQACRLSFPFPTSWEFLDSFEPCSLRFDLGQLLIRN